MGWWWTFGSVPEVNAPTLQAASQRITQAKQQQPPAAATALPTIIDVRTGGEYEGGHIQHAVNASFLPPWSFPGRVGPLVSSLDKGAEIYVICLSAHRSIGALKYLRTQGFTNVKQLQGGMQEYRRQKLPEVK